MRGRIKFVFLVLTALMLGMLIFMVDSSPGWDDTGISAAMGLAASGLMGAIHPARAWVWALAVGSWVPHLRDRARTRGSGERSHLE